MPNLPRISGKEAVAAFAQADFVVDRVSGSHHIMKKQGHPKRLSVPVHAGKTVGLGLLRRQIADAGLTVEQFLELL